MYLETTISELCMATLTWCYEAKKDDVQHNTDQIQHHKLQGEKCLRDRMIFITTLIIFNRGMYKREETRPHQQTCSPVIWMGKIRKLHFWTGSYLSWMGSWVRPLEEMSIDMVINVTENYDDVHHNVVNIQQQGEIINWMENISDAHHNNNK